jgi:formylglycine-generating enzyme required for sulfatase activity/DNA-binding SARP family transcriptional activator/energy-coupling factor transporter ATP-binding protein EcfA2
MSRLSLSLLGPLKINLDNQPVVGFDSAKSKALLAYLADDPRRVHARSTLAGILWSERPESLALGNLRHVLANLRQVLRDPEMTRPILLVERESIALNLHSDCSIDTLTFRYLVSASQEKQNTTTSHISHLKAAASLYRGEFLETFPSGDSPQFEEWLMTRRSLYQSQYLDVLNQLAEAAISQGDINLAKDYARQQIELEPWSEEAHCQLMEALALEGKRCEALNQFEICCSALRKELNVAPSHSTLQLIDAIRNETIDEHRLKSSTRSKIPNPLSIFPYPVISPSADLIPQIEPDLKQLRAKYLAHLQHSYHVLDFKGIPQLSSMSSVLAIEDVYVPLLACPELPVGETWERQRLAGRDFDQHILPVGAISAIFRDKLSPPVRVEEAINQKNRLVILGDPGSGKTTMLKYLALTLAKNKDSPLPILIPLNAYARVISRHDCSLSSFLPEYYAGRSVDVASLGPLFENAISQGQAVILLDGLDEVHNGRAAVVNKVEDFAIDALKKGNKIVVTSRIVGYREAPLALENWAIYTLLDFDAESIQQFVTCWCQTFEKSIHGNTPQAHLAAEKECQELLEAIQSNPGVARLASNPLLLTILALIKRQGIELPRSRIKLYDCYLETLIEAWNKVRSLDKTPTNSSLDFEVTLDVLGPLALRLRQENPTFGLVSEHQLLDWSKEYYIGEQWGLKPGPAYQNAVQFLHKIRSYSNLLLERGEGQFGFIHLTFEEALAAYGLVSAGQVEFKHSLEIIQSHLTEPAWYETIRLALGVWGILHRQPLVAGEVLQAMLKMECEDKESCQNILMAGACLEDMGDAGTGRLAADEVISALRITMGNRSSTPATQRDAGFILGRLAAVSSIFFQSICPDLDDFISVKPGRFCFGGDSVQEFTVVDSKAFSIAKYPVTNLQYRRFIRADGYNQREFWSDEGWGWRIGKYDLTARHEYHELLIKRPPERRGEPYYWRDEKWNNPLAPVVGLSWFEAEAYCTWLTMSRNDNKVYRLPSEEEWERAARGENGREFAWGNDYDQDKFNTAAFWNRDDGYDWVKDINVSSTTIVNHFPDGRTPDGIFDICGNVWEWTASWFGDEQVNRVVRGTSWGDQRKKVRSAYRDWLTPVDYVNVIGFRVFSSG